MAGDGPGGFTAVTTMKNEGAFLIEWAAHHLALGFDRLFICTNDCADPTTRMALRLQAMGLARHHGTRKWPTTSIQRSALKQARRYPEVTGADWVYVCDADEFLTIRLGDGSVQALVAAASPEVEVISIPWRIFGPDGAAVYEERPVTEQFRRAQAAPADPRRRPAYCKSLFRGDLHLWRMGIHAPVPHPDLGRDFVTELPGGRRIAVAGKAMHVPSDFSLAQVNHYALRSADSFLVKRERGRVNHSDQVMELDYWTRFDIAEVACDAVRRYDVAAAAWRARLLADAELAALHAEAAAWHRDRIAHLKAQPDYAAMAAAIAERQARCASLPS
jgi:hypothetical protein